MNRQLDHMVRLIDDLLDISRISRGLLELQKERVELPGLLRATVDSVRPLFERKGQTLSLATEESIAVDADPTRVAQMLTNLLHNATKFTPNGGAVKVELVREGADAVIRIADAGVGIPGDQLERIFDMFSRVPRPGGAAEPGLGIGLALARRLAAMHGGSLTAASQGVGRGTTFTLRMPTLQAVGEEPTEAGAPVNGARLDGQRPLDIVVIEDNDDVADTLLEWLEELGHRVRIARTGEQGVALVREATPGLVLCDLGLPGMDGLDVCRSIRALALEPSPLMVAVTGWGRNGDRQRTKEAGFDRHLVKPVAPDDLLAILRDAGDR